MRVNRAVLAAFLCSAAAPAATCDPTQQMSPFNAGQWTTLEDSGATMSRTMATPYATTPEMAQMPDATVLFRERLVVDKPLVNETIAPADTLPSTSTAPDPALQTRLLMALLGLILSVAGGVMLLLPRR